MKQKYVSNGTMLNYMYRTVGKSEVVDTYRYVGIGRYLFFNIQGSQGTLQEWQSGIILLIHYFRLRPSLSFTNLITK